MQLSAFDFALPNELIAQFPSRRRDQSRLLVLDRKTGARQHRRFRDIVEYLKSGDLLVLNNTRVFKARLWAARRTGGRTEIFLVRLESQEGKAELWNAMVSPSRRLNAGEELLFEDGASVRLESYFGDGRWLVRFATTARRRRIVREFGHVPLPHYIGRTDAPADLSRYQTVFADRHKEGAVAAPTAGFHFTKGLLKELADKRIVYKQVTLHVGPGTFKPVSAEDISQHSVDPEWAELPHETAEAINVARGSGGRIVAVGTTSVRTLESAKDVCGLVQPFAGMVSTYIQPGHQFRWVDAMVTNFHLPKSSLLILVSAFAGRELILESYAEAIREGYRFYSYGDAMLIL